MSSIPQTITCLICLRYSNYKRCNFGLTVSELNISIYAHTHPVTTL